MRPLTTTLALGLVLAISQLQTDFVHCQENPACATVSTYPLTATPIPVPTNITVLPEIVVTNASPNEYKVEVVVANSDADALSISVAVRGTSLKRGEPKLRAKDTGTKSIFEVDLDSMKLDKKQRDRGCDTPVVTVKVLAPTDTCWKRLPGNVNHVILVSGEFCVRVLHINDFHSHALGQMVGPCGNLNTQSSASASVGNNEWSAKCDGGWARVFSMTKQLARTAKGRTVFVDGGDQVSGTAWSAAYKGLDSAQFLSALCANPDVAHCFAGLGNHEFDGGYDTARAYVNALANVSVIVSNLEDNCGTGGGDQAAQQRIGAVVRDQSTVQVGKYTVGVVGYLAPSIRSVSALPACITLHDEVAKVRLS
jgi:hypothetical protein